jgi:8-oxo-dGTP pyrophosphatase MutT (NUDIX family)
MPFTHIRYANDRIQVVENDQGWARVVPTSPAGAVIFPVMPNGDFLLVCEERETAHGPQLQWNLPRGSSDPGESARETAMRELEEETALKVPADRFVQLTALCPDSGLLLHTVPVFAAVLHGLEAHPMADGKEILSIRAFSESELCDMALRGELSDVFTLAALSLWKAFCRQQGVSLAGTHSLSLSVTLKGQPALFQALLCYQHKLRAAGWQLRCTEAHVGISAVWLPGQRPSLDGLEDAALGSFEPILRLLGLNAG